MRLARRCNAPPPLSATAPAPALAFKSLPMMVTLWSIRKDSRYSEVSSLVRGRFSATSMGPLESARPVLIETLW